MSAKETEKARKMWLAEVEVLDQIGADIVKHQMSDEVIAHVRKDKNIKCLIHKKINLYTFSYSNFIILMVDQDGYRWRLDDHDFSFRSKTKQEVIDYINKTEYYTGSRDPIVEGGCVSVPDYPDYEIFMDQTTYEPFQG